MKKIVLTALLSLLVLAAEAQLKILDLGVKGGLTTQTYKFSGEASHAAYLIDPGTRVGFHFGVMGRVNLAMFHVQPELVYTFSGYNLGVSSKTVWRPDGSETKVRMNMLDLPVLFGVKLLWFRMQAGPVFSLVTDVTTKGGRLVSDIDISRPFMGYMAGLGCDIGKINLDVRYQGQFKRIKHNVLFSGETLGHTYKSRARSWQFSVGYMF